MRDKRTRTTSGQVISIEEAKAAAQAGRRRAHRRKSGTSISSERKIRNFERWLEEIYPELIRI
jgi:hypothetical protein